MALNTRVQRPQREMVEALRNHVRLLETYAQELFVRGDQGYAGEVAGKLRLLVCRFRSNEPLLLRLLEKTGAKIPLHLDGPPIPLTAGGPILAGEISLPEYLELEALWIRTPSDTLAKFSKTLLIRAWAEQTGSPHEDWTMDEGLRAALEANIIIMGMPAAVAELRTTCEAVLSVSRRFLEAVDRGAIAVSE